MKHEAIQAYYDRRHAAEDAFPRDDARTRDFLRSLLENSSPGHCALDLGCGVGYACEILDGAGYSIVGIEIAEPALEAARNRVPSGRFFPADPSGRIPLESGAVDGLICLGVLEHIPDPAPVLNECSRVLKDDGLAVFVVPNSRSPYFSLGSGTGQEFEEPRTLREWKSLFEDAGLAVRSCRKDPGPSLRPSFSWKKKLRIGAHRCLNRLPLTWTYQFVFELAKASRS